MDPHAAFGGAIRSTALPTRLLYGASGKMLRLRQGNIENYYIFFIIICGFLLRSSIKKIQEIVMSKKIHVEQG